MNSLKKKSKNYKYKIKHHNKQKGGLIESSTDHPEFEKQIVEFRCVICLNSNDGPLIQFCKSHVGHLNCIFNICPYIENATLKYKYISKLKTDICPLCKTTDTYTFKSSFHTVIEDKKYYLNKREDYTKTEEINVTRGDRLTAVLQHPNNKFIFKTEEICDNIILEFENIEKLLNKYITLLNDSTTTQSTPNIDLNLIKTRITNIYNIHTSSNIELYVNSLRIGKTSLDSLDSLDSLFEFNWLTRDDEYNIPNRFDRSRARTVT